MCVPGGPVALARLQQGGAVLADPEGHRGGPVRHEAAGVDGARVQGVPAVGRLGLDVQRLAAGTGRVIGLLRRGRVVQPP